MNHQICIVSADQKLANALSVLAAHVGFQSSIYPSANTFLRHHAQLPPTVVLIDLQLSDGSGLHALATLRFSDSRHVVIASSDDPSARLAVEAMRLGAHNYLPRPMLAGELAAALHDGQLALSRREKNDDQLAEAQAAVKKLSHRQLEVLQGMVSGQTNAMIGMRLGLSTRTIEAYRRSLMQRLGTNHSSEAIRMAITAGLTTDQPNLTPHQRPAERQRRERSTR